MFKEGSRSGRSNLFSDFSGILIFLALILQPGLITAQVTDNDAREKHYGLFMDEVNKMENEGRFEESKTFLIDQWDNFPGHWFDMARELVYINKKTNQFQDNLPIFKEGHERGYFFFLHPQLPSCKPYLQYDAFQAIAEKDMALRQEAIKRSELTWEIRLPENYSGDKTWPLIMILHGGGSSTDRAKEHWVSPLLSKYFITVYVQSYLHYDSHSYGWRKYDPRAREGLVDCYNSIKAKYSIDTASISICGISAGATMAMDAYVSELFPLSSVLAFSPSLPAEFYVSLKEMTVSEEKSAMIMIGELDTEKRLSECEEMARALDSAGLKCSMDIIPGLGHDYPMEFTSRLNYALWKMYPGMMINSNRPLKVIDLDGDAYEIGYRHGSILKDEIKEMILRWKDVLKEEYGICPDVAIGKFFAETSYIHYVHEYARELVMEIQGIADGSGIPFKTMLAFQMSEEFEVQGKRLFPSKCTAVAIPAKEGNAPIVAQNMDPPLFLQGYPTLLKIHNYDTNSEIMVFTVPGLIGLNGMSRHGFAVACNGISMLNSAADGMPVAFVMRKLLAMESLMGAEAYLKQIKHATPQAYTVGDRKSVICYECSANECKPYITFKKEGIVLHTNFSIANKDFNEYYVKLLSEYGKTVEDPYFCPRFYLLYDIIQEQIENMDQNFLKSVLRLDKPEISPILNKNTYGSSIMILGERPDMHICTGKTHDQFTQLTFE
ncbi:MAG: C45 family autoproteolytic acyltransferase/hydrolase [Bacteroidales bacterium]|jgi:predicted esterase|nr:C45 family autoproteolytic acyltransferase/hydrolase [Bacteroidales bacterium]